MNKSVPIIPLPPPKLEQGRVKLQTTNEIHNFTQIQLPEEVTNVLNKGTTLILTQENLNSHKPCKPHNMIRSQLCSRTNNQEARSILFYLQDQNKEKEPSHIQRKIPSNFFKKNNLNLILIFTLLITSIIQFHTLCIIHNPQISTNSYNHIILTLPLQSKSTTSNFKTAQTSSSHKLTKKWDVHLCLFHGLQMNANDTVQTLIHTD